MCAEAGQGRLEAAQRARGRASSEDYGSASVNRRGRIERYLQRGSDILLLYGGCDMELRDLLTMVASFLILPTLVYFGKYPHAKGDPFSRTEELMMIPLFLSFCCLLAVGFLMFARR